MGHTDCATEFARYEDIDDPAFLEYDQADPVGVLGRASKQCIEDALSRGVVGSSTALICVLRNNTLRVANLGDCNVSCVSEWFSFQESAVLAKRFRSLASQCDSWHALHFQISGAATFF